MTRDERTTSQQRPTQGRNRCACTRDPAAERLSLRDVVRQLVDEIPQTESGLRAKVVDEYGSCTRVQIRGALRQLIRDGVILWQSDGYVAGRRP